MTELAHYLKTRRSSLSMTLDSPGPDRAQLREMLTIASRVPDHGKLAPWRFELWTRDARKMMHGKLAELLMSMELPAGAPTEKSKMQQGSDKILHAPCVVAVISRAADHPKIPKWEQVLSAGAVCQNLLMAANAHGFEAQWLTAWYIYEDRARPILGLSDGEQIAGIIHIGSCNTPKSERPRPDLDSIFKIREA